MPNIEDMLGKSKPLEEAMNPKPTNEYTKEFLKLLEMNIPEPILISWFENNEKALTAKGNLRMDFFDYYLEYATLHDLNNLDQKYLTFKQQKVFDAKRESDDWGITDEERDSRILQYINKNADLIKENADYKRLHSGLYKKIAELQSQRDNLGESLENYINLHEQGKELVLHYKSLCKELVLIFKKHKLSEDISEDNVDLLYSVMKEVEKDA